MSCLHRQIRRHRAQDVAQVICTAVILAMFMAAAVLV